MLNTDQLAIMLANYHAAALGGILANQNFNTRGIDEIMKVAWRIAEKAMEFATSPERP